MSLDDDPSHDGIEADHDGRQHEQHTSRHGVADDNPAPWEALDYDAYVTDDRASRLDVNVPSPDVGSCARTGFHPPDAEDTERWSRLLERNIVEGDDYSTRKFEVAKNRDVDIVCDRLGSTDRHRDRVKYLLDEIDVKKQLLPNGPIEIAIMGVASMVIDEERTRYARDGIDTKSVMRDDEFATLLDDFGIERSRIHDVRKRLRDTDVWQADE